MIYSSRRTFRMWDYCVSHGQLLLRSLRDGNYEFMVDLVFYGVEWIDIGPDFQGITVELINDTYTDEMVGRHAEYVRENVASGSFLYRLRGDNGSVGYIMCRIIHFFEIDGEFYITSLDSMGRPNLPEEAKRTLVKFPDYGVRDQADRLKGAQP